MALPTSLLRPAKVASRTTTLTRHVAPLSQRRTFTVPARTAIYPSLKSKIITISGGAGGIGRETAKLLAASGARISLADYSEKPLMEFAEELSSLTSQSGGDVSASVVDVRKEDTVERWISKTISDFGGGAAEAKIDGAANLAGILPSSAYENTGAIGDMDNKLWDNTLAVNLTGLMYTMRAQLRHFNDHGSIVNAASVASLRGYPNSAAYVASKHGVVGLSKCAAQDLGKDRGIRVNCVAPGTIRTSMIQDFGMGVGELEHNPVMPGSLDRDGLPQEVASLIVWLLSEESSFVTGAVYSIDGGHTT